MPYAAPTPLNTGASTRPIPVLQFIADTVGVGGSAAAPGAGAAVATLTTPPAGTYRVQVFAGLGVGAAGAAAENLNMQLQAGATVISKLAMAELQAASNFCGEFILTLDGATSLTVNAVGAATAATVYIAQITATRIR